ncbi:hypothetical protein ScPMuIL_004309 [Solemya velum]
MRLFRLRFILLGLLLCIFHVWCRTCGTEFTDAQSSAYLATIVLGGTVYRKEGSSLYVNVTRVFKGEHVLRRKNKKWDPVKIGDFGVENKLDCVAKVPKDGAYIFFLNELISSEARESGRLNKFQISAFPVEFTKKNSKSVRRILTKKGKKPPKIKPIKSVEARLGKPVKLRCKASGKPAVRYAWTMNGKRVTRGVKTGRKQSSLRFRKLSAHHVGTYVCTVTNVVGQDSKSASITALYYSNISFFTLTILPQTGPRYTACEEDYKNYCLNNGICQNITEIGQLTCSCRENFTGDRCQEMSSPVLGESGAQRKLDKDRTLIIVGIVTGVLVFIFICIASFFLAKRRREKYDHLREEKKRAQRKNIPQNSAQAVSNGDVELPSPKSYSGTSSGTQTDDTTPYFGQSRCEFNVPGVLNTRNRLAASSGTESSSQTTRPRSADGRFVYSETPLAYDMPDSCKPYPGKPNMSHEPNKPEVIVDELNKNDDIPVVNVTSPPSPSYQENPTSNCEINGTNGPMTIPVLNIDGDLESDTESNISENSKLYISEDENSGHYAEGDSLISDSPELSRCREDALNHNGGHAFNNYNDRKFGSDSTTSSSPSSQSNYSVRHVAPPNGDVKNKWDASEPSERCYPPYAVSSQSDPALASERRHPISFY